MRIGTAESVAGNTCRLCGLCGHKRPSEFYIFSDIIFIYILQERRHEKLLVSTLQFILLLKRSTARVMTVNYHELLQTFLVFEKYDKINNKLTINVIPL